ncbi:MAG: SDR family oxidoreductase [Actinobacteria bacterium]|nr:SDR family oxidoreductase [Actinomycetota bacterium]
MASRDHVAFVTGAGRGIGRRVALTFAERGYRIAANDLDAPEETLGFGRIDVLVNNAGISLITPAEETSLADWRRVLDVNLTGPFLTSREFGMVMLEQGSGSIVNVSSVAGLLGVADRAAYNASKHGLVGLTRTLAAEWGGRGVRVNAVCPGWVKTEMDVEDQAGDGYTDEDIEGRVPMGRFARPEDVARAVAFLADPEQSGFVNGHTLSVDGGWYGDGGWESLRRGKQAL